MEPREGGTDQEDREVGNQRFDFGGAEQSRNICQSRAFGEEGSFFRKQRLAGFLRGVFFRPTDFFANLHRRKPVFLSFAPKGGKFWREIRLACIKNNII